MLGFSGLGFWKEAQRVYSVGEPSRVSIEEKNARGTPPRASRTGQDQAIPTYRPYCRWRSPETTPSVAGDRQIAIGSRTGTPALQRDRSGSGDPALQSVPRRSPRGGQAPALLQRAPHFACFTSPNVVNARCAGDTGPRNRRINNVSGLPPNETSSIW